MAVTAEPPTTPPAPTRGTPPARRFDRRPPLPAPRAVLGAVLVVAAVVGTFVAAGGGTPPAPPQRVVASRAIGPGDVLRAPDLTTEAVDLGAADAAAFASPDDLEGAVALAPLGPGELVQRGAVALPGPDPLPARAPELTITLDRHRALGGHLQPGEPVDVVGTLGTGAEAETDVVAHDVVVVAVEAVDDGLGASVAVTLAPGDDEEVLAVAHVAEVGAVVLVRPGGGR